MRRLRSAWSRSRACREHETDLLRDASCGLPLRDQSRVAAGRASRLAREWHCTFGCAFATSVGLTRPLTRPEPLPNQGCGGRQGAKLSSNAAAITPQ